MKPDRFHMIMSLFFAVLAFGLWKANQSTDMCSEFWWHCATGLGAPIAALVAVAWILLNPICQLFDWLEEIHETRLEKRAEKYRQTKPPKV